jgi:D-hexose-6-phosphate mutarotase
VVFKEDPEGNVRVEILNSYATASIMMQGAHLISWVPKDEQPVIWLSREAKFSTGKSIRGGIPVCWPWFGPHDSESSFPAHGFARTIPWQIIETRQLENGYTQLVFQIVQSEQTQKSWPYPCELIMTFTIGAELKVELLTRNTGDTAFVIGEALHTYFAVSDASKISINGLDNCTYLDKLDNFQRKIQSGSIEIAEEVDRVYLDTSSTCIINDPGLKRKICINKTASDSTVVWNPWLETANKMGDLGENGHLEMVCVESANAADNVVTVKSGEDHLFTVNYAIEKMS